jgi:hypothetical protein
LTGHLNPIFDFGFSILEGWTPGFCASFFFFLRVTPYSVTFWILDFRFWIFDFGLGFLMGR